MGGTYEVQNFPRLNESVQRTHDLFDASGVIPPMHVQEIDVGRPKLLERGVDGDVQRFAVVTDIHHLLSHGQVSTLEVRCILKEIT